jgi:hypothetical protein
LREIGRGLEQKRRLREAAPRNPRSRFYYSTRRNTVLRCSTMIEACGQPISSSRGNGLSPHIGFKKEKYHEETDRDYCACPFNERRRAGFRARHHVRGRDARRRHRLAKLISQRSNTEARPGAGLPVFQEEKK